MAHGDGIEVHGVNETIRAFQRVDAKVARELRTSFGRVAEPVVDQAQANVRRLRLVKSGDMLRKFRVSVRRGEAVVRNTSRHRGYDYPRKIEYTDRSFLRSALDTSRREVLAAFEQWVDDTLDTFEGT